MPGVQHAERRLGDAMRAGGRSPAGVVRRVRAPRASRFGAGGTSVRPLAGPIRRFPERSRQRRVEWSAPARP